MEVPEMKVGIGSLTFADIAKALRASCTCPECVASRVGQGSRADAPESAELRPFQAPNPLAELLRGVPQGVKITIETIAYDEGGDE